MITRASRCAPSSEGKGEESTDAPRVTSARRVHGHRFRIEGTETMNRKTKDTAKRGAVETTLAVIEAERNPLSREDARKVLGVIHAELTKDGPAEPPVAFLLLLFALAQEPGERMRYAIFDEAREMFAVHIDGVHEAVRQAMADTLDALRKEASQ
jgi:hypothetical protein